MVVLWPVRICSNPLKLVSGRCKYLSFLLFFTAPIGQTKRENCKTDRNKFYCYRRIRGLELYYTEQSVPARAGVSMCTT